VFLGFLWLLVDVCDDPLNFVFIKFALDREQCPSLFWCNVCSHIIVSNALASYLGGLVINSLSGYQLD
jgi:hypothetical protein